MPFKYERCLEIKESVDLIGRVETAKKLNMGIPSVAAALRSLNQYEEKMGIENDTIHKDFNPAATLKKIASIYSEKELKILAEGKSRLLDPHQKIDINFEGKSVRVGILTDTHIGHIKFNEDRLFAAFEEFKKEKVDFICHAGDVTEGMSNRDGHIYELTHLGYENQKNYAIELFGNWTDSSIYAIDGNHDRWYIKSNGALIVKDIAAQLENFHFIGHDEGDIVLNDRVKINLWHGEDGNSYALSYRVQKIIESLAGGNKPNIMFCGHTHKYVKLFERNIHAISAGCIQDQSSWMRGKRIAAHTGFGIYDITFDNTGIKKLKETWFPFY